MGPPISGALEAIQELARDFRVVVLTAETELDHIRRWLDHFGFPPMLVTNVKVPAIAYIDDRGIHFTNWQDALAEFRRLKPQLIASHVQEVRTKY